MCFIESLNCIEENSPLIFPAKGQYYLTPTVPRKEREKNIMVLILKKMAVLYDNYVVMFYVSGFHGCIFGT